MARHPISIALILGAVIASFAGCRGYGYRHGYGGGPHMDGTPEWTFPLIMSHRPVPCTELRKVYPPESNISTK